jgi:hypothetical protein
MKSGASERIEGPQAWEGSKDAAKKMLSVPKSAIPNPFHSFAVALLLCTFGVAADDKHAQIPEKMMAAKTVFIQNETGEIKFSDNIRKQLEDKL